MSGIRTDYFVCECCGETFHTISPDYLPDSLVMRPPHLCGCNLKEGEDYPYDPEPPPWARRIRHGR
jgi:hypothetical protein